jgi:hypothetical protein
MLRDLHTPRLQPLAPPRTADRHDRFTLPALRAVVILAGTVRPNQFRRAVGRFPLDLPIDSTRCVMDAWRSHIADLASALSLTRLPVRVMIDRATPKPMDPPAPGPCDIRFESDPLDFRGTGGLLSDLANQYDDNDYLLVLHGAQILFEPLTSLVHALAAPHADVALASLDDATPAGIMLVRCGCLRAIPRVGFVDLNEQALPLIARKHHVAVVRQDLHLGAPIRTLGGYLEALRHYHRRLVGRSDADDPFAEDWRATFTIVEHGATVHPSAVVHDSVVLAGGQVHPHALLVRALVCPGGVVLENKSAIDCLVTGRLSDLRRAGE